MIPKRSTRSIAATALAATVCLAGCQTIGSWLPQHDKVTDARNAAGVIDNTPSEPITTEQKINVQLAVGQSFEDEKQPEQAAKIYQEAIKKDSHCVVAYHRLALLYAKKGEWENSRKYFDLAIKYAPKDVVILCDQGYSNYLQHRDDEAETCLRKAISIDADYACAHNDLGLVLARRGHEEAALKEFTKAGCNQAQAHANLAMAYSLENRIADARLHYGLALASDPNLGIAKSGMIALDSLDRSRVQIKEAAVPVAPSNPMPMNAMPMNPAPSSPNAVSSNAVSSNPAPSNRVQETALVTPGIPGAW